ncbi:MAG: ADOP family duplicated permease [Vicinamibacteraceae bacterium]
MRRLILKLLRRRRLHHDLKQEIAFHREMAAAGNNPIPFGHATNIIEQSLDLWRFTALENLWRDVVYAARGLRRSPGLVSSALLSLGLGIGLNATIFSLAVGLLFSEPSVRDPESVVYVQVDRNTWAQPHVLDFIRQSAIFQDIAGETAEANVNWNDGTATTPLFTVVTTKNYFTTLGVPVARGRGWTPDDPDEVVVLRHDFWQKHFNGNPSVIGRPMNLDGRAYTILGILPKGHRTLLGFGFSPDVYLPRYEDDTMLGMYARLKAGMSLGDARAHLAAVGARLDAAFPEPWKYRERLRVSPIAGFGTFQNGELTSIVGLFFGMLLLVVSLVLLIACVNVAGLLLARASARHHEIAIRLSLGSSRSRLFQQMLVESALLSLLGTGLGFLLAHAAATLLAGIHLPLPIPIRLQIDPDWHVVVYSALLGIGVTLACGLLPARQAIKESISARLRRERRMRLRRALIVGQVAVTVVVLATSFLFVRNLYSSAAIDPGFDVHNTLLTRVFLPPDSYDDRSRKAAYLERAVQELETLPGIEAAAAARIIPFNGHVMRDDDLVLPNAGEKIPVHINPNVVTPGYFRALDIPVLAGRTFSNHERGANVVIVNRTFVERYLGNRNAVGTVFYLGPDKRPYRIVGVVGDTKTLTIGEDAQPQFYEPLMQTDYPGRSVQLVMRSATPPVTQLAPVRRALRRVEPAAGLQVGTLYGNMGLAFLPSQIGAALLGSSGLLGLLLAAIGLHGIVAYSVTRRKPEIAVRIAVGAGSARIARMVIGEAAKLIAVGSIAGLAIAALVTRPLAMFLVPGLSPTDATSFALVLAVLAGAGLLATLGPVRRALLIDPVVSLRSE